MQQGHSFRLSIVSRTATAQVMAQARQGVVAPLVGALSVGNSGGWPPGGLQPIWRRPLDTDRWLHMPIDLSRWKGKTVDLALECQLDGDKTRGQAEVLLDYLTILTQE